MIAVALRRTGGRSGSEDGVAVIYPGEPEYIDRLSLVCASAFAAASLATFTSCIALNSIPGYHTPSMIGIGTTGFIMAALLAWVPRVRSMRYLVGNIVLGALLLSLSVYFSGPYAPRTVLVYVWLGTVVFGFFPVSVGWLYTAVFSAGYAVVLARQRGPGLLVSLPFSAWLITVGTVAGVGYFISRLVRRIHLLAVAEHRARGEAERANEELEVASQRKTEFLANMSHELRTPLNAVIGFSQVLEDELFGELNERQLEYVGDILSSGRHLLALINDILDLAKVEAGHMELEPAAVSVAEVLDVGLTMVRERASAHRIELGLDVEGCPGEVVADGRKLTQVVFNLLSNAVKFTPDGGRVLVVARGVGDEVEVSVSDTGIGIAPEEHELVFEQFRQAGGTVREGTGLGLALTRQFVELHGGRIWVASVPGQGSTFTFRIPTDASPNAGRRPGPATKPDVEDDGALPDWRGPGSEQTPDRLARVCAATFAGAGAAGLISVALNGTFLKYNRSGILAVSAVAVVVGLIVALTAPRIPRAESVGLLVGGNLLVTLVVYFSGPYAPRTVLVYVCLAGVVAGFFPRWVGVLHGILVAVGYGVVLALNGDLPAFKGVSSPAAAWLITAGTFAWVLIFVRWQVDRIHLLAVAEHRARGEAERANEELEVASQRKTEFLANMSHELRTPLNAVIGFSQVLEDELFGELNERQLEYVGDILSSGRHLLALINDILDLAKVEAGHMELEPAAVSVAEVLDVGLTMVRERASAHRIELGLDVEGCPGEVVADGRKLTQVVFNLLSNVVKFTPDGGRVLVVARGVGDEVEVSVSDTGIGIAPEEHELVFEQFRQAGGTVREGTGLGLALTRQFVELHGGRIWVASVPGQGSTFTFRIPTDARRIRDPSPRTLSDAV